MLLYWLLKDIWHLGDGASPKNVLQATAKSKTFRDKLRGLDPHTIAPIIKRDFRRALRDDARRCREEHHPTLKIRFKKLREQIPYSRLWKNIPKQIREEVSAVIGELRAILAATCIRSISPDLIILDEFQRFKNLLDGEDDAGKLAQKLFEWEEAHVLLLSATPYKMYTNAHDGEDHYQDFLRTIRFLEPEAGVVGNIDKLLKAYRRQLLRLGDDLAQNDLPKVKQELEARLKQFMLRTERLAASPDRNGMLREHMIETGVNASDLKAYLGLHEVIAWLDSDQEDYSTGNQIEFWKSAPYLLNFMERDDYKFKSLFRETLDSVRRGTLRSQSLAECVTRASEALLDWEHVDRYQRVLSKNPRVQALLEQTLEHEGCSVWRLLWLPPTAPYYRLAGPFAKLTDPLARLRLTKRLIFSNWRVVPKAVATLLSYEVERRQFQSYQNRRRRYSDEVTRRARLMEFARSKGRLTGMPVLGMIYPSLVFATECDPLRLGSHWFCQAMTPSREELLDLVKVRLETLLAPMIATAEPSEQPDYDWYWAAPILLDFKHYPEATQAWFDQPGLAWDWKGETETDPDQTDDTAWEDHVELGEKQRAVTCNWGDHRTICWMCCPR